MNKQRSKSRQQRALVGISGTMTNIRAWVWCIVRNRTISGKVALSKSGLHFKIPTSQKPCKQGNKRKKDADIIGVCTNFITRHGRIMYDVGFGEEQESGKVASPLPTHVELRG
jgi:hypothetical protein